MKAHARRASALFVLLVKKKLVALCERNVAASAEAERQSRPPVLKAEGSLISFPTHPALLGGKE